MADDLTADDIIGLLDLAPLEGEGGFFRQTWIRPSAGTGPDVHPEATCIYYLITPGSFSALHRLRHDEIFHFYLGDPCRQTIIGPDGSLEHVILGPDLRNGILVQHVVPGGAWQATRLCDGGRFALLGTTMSPGFHESGFELARAEDLVDLEPGVRSALEPLLAAAT